MKERFRRPYGLKMFRSGCRGHHRYVSDLVLCSQLWSTMRGASSHYEQLNTRSVLSIMQNRHDCLGQTSLNKWAPPRSPWPFPTIGSTMQSICRRKEPILTKNTTRNLRHFVTRARTLSYYERNADLLLNYMRKFGYNTTAVDPKTRHASPANTHV
jgi:hypothetical protein